MYLSRLVLNHRHRSARRDLADCQQMHRTVMSGFDDLPDDQARHRLGVLYRIEPRPYRNCPVVLVQSLVEPNWSHLPPGYLADLSDPVNPDVRRIDRIYESLSAGMELRFRLRANPTRKVDTRTGADGKKNNGRRVAVTGEEGLRLWLTRKGQGGGFEVVSCRNAPDCPDVYSVNEPGVRVSSTVKSLRFHSVLFEGRLRITDRSSFLDTLAAGIGSGKAFGFGLLSVAATG